MEFRQAVETALARFPELDPERAARLEEAVARAGAQAAAEGAGFRWGLRVAADALTVRALARTLENEASAPFERVLHARLCSIEPQARQLAILAFVKRAEFVDAVSEMGMNGAALAEQVTRLRKLADPAAAAAPPADTPAYVRIPFLVSGHLTPEDALRVREYLGQSETCRAAYRDLDKLERMLARAGPACGEEHPEAEEILAVADRAPISPLRKDAIAEHVRICAGCEAVLAALRATAPRSPAGTLAAKLDAPAERRKLAAAAVLLALGAPVALHAAMSAGGKAIEAGVAPGEDLGVSLSEDASRAPTEIRIPPGAPAFTVTARMPLEANMAFDLRVEKAGGGEVESAGGVPFESVGGGEGRVNVRLRSDRFPDGDYALVLLRRFVNAGGAPAERTYPFRVRRGP